MAGDTIMKPNKEKQAKICAPSTVLNPWQVFPFFSTTIIPPETPPISTRKEISLHSHWSGCDNHERNSLPKAITAPSAVPTSQTQWRWVCVFMAAAPGRVWKMLIGVTSCEAACAWISSPCSFCNLSKIQLKFLSKIVFFLYVAQLLSTFISSATVVFNYPLGGTQMSQPVGCKPGCWPGTTFISS